MKLATSYANSFYQAAQELSVSGEELSKLVTQLQDFQELLGALPPLKAMLLAPFLPRQEKIALLTTLSAASAVAFHPLVREFLLLLTRKNRLPLLLAILTSLKAALALGQGELRGTVSSSQALSPQELTEVAALFTAKLQKKVSLEPQIDPALLAGLKVTVLGVTYDGTLLNQLQQLQAHLTQSPPL